MWWSTRRPGGGVQPGGSGADCSMARLSGCMYRPLAEDRREGTRGGRPTGRRGGHKGAPPAHPPC
eukprot:1586618-Alexandrium_andersonii.AAC.1